MCYKTKSNQTKPNSIFFFLWKVRRNAIDSQIIQIIIEIFSLITKFLLVNSEI